MCTEVPKTVWFEATWTAVAHIYAFRAKMLSMAFCRAGSLGKGIEYAKKYTHP